MLKGFAPLLLLVLFFSCRKDQPPVPPAEVPLNNGLSGELLVMNEGNFMYANASLTRIQLENGSSNQQYFETVNGQSMGDVAQSMCFYQGKVWFVMNNSQKIIVADSVGMKKEFEITGLGSPRYLTFLHPQKAFVSDLYANAIQIINPRNGSLLGSIPLQGWTEQMCISGGKLFAGNWSGSATYIIDANTNQIIDSVLTGKHSAWLSKDKAGRIWVLSSGDANQPPAISCIDPENHLIISKESLPLEGDISSRLVYDAMDHCLYFLAGDVFQYRINAHEGERLAKVIRSDGNNFYGLDLDPKRRILMVSDARNFVQRGSVSLHLIDLQFKDCGRYECGMIPSAMVIR